MTEAYFILAHDKARIGASSLCMTAEDGTVVRFSEPKKSREQEEHYHAIIAEIAKTETLHGIKLDAESWKRLLIDAFKHDTYQEMQADWAQVGGTQLLPALNHPGVVMVGEQSRRFTKKLATAFITWLQAFQDGVR